MPIAFVRLIPFNLQEDLKRHLLIGLLHSELYEYFNAVLINERDKDGNFLELGKEFILAPNDHFNNLPVNISLSDVQVPTNMYNKAAEMYFVLRGPASSDLAIDGMYSEHTLRAWSLAAVTFLGTTWGWSFRVRGTWARGPLTMKIRRATPQGLEKCVLGASWCPMQQLLRESSPTDVC
ncbi:hypothetical protein PANDA_020429 [Ailuropoda melanoleuca]|uniref:VWA N-terminal domain-containing protein n=1 Tax=Ailuropoda melanoleuca TaxID=9646 RepID=D2I4C3_AILME|nr:hypothetical protein PANDA_020429 [Ailuropoda melanoleuca]